MLSVYFPAHLLEEILPKNVEQARLMLSEVSWENAFKPFGREVVNNFCVWHKVVVSENETASRDLVDYHQDVTTRELLSRQYFSWFCLFAS